MLAKQRVEYLHGLLRRPEGQQSVFDLRATAHYLGSLERRRMKYDSASR